MEFNYDDPVKNYQARYFKNLGYSDQDILGILGDLPSADTGGGVTPQLVQQLGYSNDGGGDRSDFIGKIPENYYTPEGAGTIPNNNIINASITPDLVDEFTPNRFDVPGGISSFGLANNPNEEDYIEESMLDKFGNTFQAFRNSPFSTIASVAGGIPTVLANLASRATQGGKNYQQFTPGMTYNQDASMINDFYDPETGTNRFDRAKSGSFASFRTLADYFNRDKGNDGGNGGNGGGGGGARSGGSSSGGTSSTNSGMGNLGFSDIRLKENVKLIGKSPSNINIYKFNYKDNPTTYQGAMAHEVPWASVKHSNGYMMVDYSKLDVQFKKL